MVTRNSANTYITPTTANEVTMPAQPAFMAYLGTTDSNETGGASSTVFILGDTDVGTALTEVFDQNNDFTTGSSAGAIFTAPVTGRYCFLFGIHSGGYDGTQSRNITYLETTTVSAFQTFRANPTNLRDVSNEICIGGTTLVNMDAADTAYVRFSSLGTNKTVDILNTNRNTFFSGYLAV